MTFLLLEPKIKIPNNYDYNDLKKNLSVSDYQLHTEYKLIKIKENTSSEEFNKIVHKLDNEYINSAMKMDISNKEYSFIDNWKHPFRRASLFIYTKKMKYYIKILDELSKSYLYYKYKSFNDTRWILTSLYILANDYFDKIEKLIENNTLLSQNALLLFKINFYKGLIEGRNVVKKQTFWIGNVPMVFNMKIIWRSDTCTGWIANEDTESQFYKKDLLYKRLEQTKEKLRDFINRKKKREVISDLFQSQSKYIPLVRDRYILKGIVKEMKNNIDFWSEKDGIGDKLKNISLNMPTNDLFQLVTKYLEDRHFENYFLEFLNEQDKKGLQKIIKIFSPDNIKHNLSNNKKIEQLFELFKKKGNENEVCTSGKLPHENIKHIYEYADI